MRRVLPFAIIAGVLVVVILGTVASIRSRRAAGTTPFSVSPVSGAAPSSGGATPVRQDSSSVAPGASIPPVSITLSVTVEEFGDYQCPPCGKLHPDLKQIIKGYGERVVFIFRNFPLPQMHKNAQVAAQAAEAARLQGRFDEMHDQLYEHQADWKDQEDPRPAFQKYARSVGLDVKRFAADMDGNEVREVIEFDRQTGLARQVTGTPTLFIEGRALSAEHTDAAGVRTGIELMLARKAAAKR
jgi:protein-disulfide isomerase